MDRWGFYALLRKAVDEAGGQSAWARSVMLTPSYVNDVLVGRRDPGPAVLSALGLRRVVTYEVAE
jgi:DNA-binding transcriptional regulator YdaS (Cro superfamily)